MNQLRHDAGQLLIAGFEGHDLPSHLAEALRGKRIGGTILFSRNVDGPQQVATLNEEILRAAHHPQDPRDIPFLSVDQEGGRVQRIREPLTRIPPMSAVGRFNDPDVTASLGEAMGDELAALGFNLNFAPCADVRTNLDNEVIGDRAFSGDVDEVSRHAGALALGLTISGVIPCAKHFPGHGDTLLDSHVELPRVEHSIETLRHRELRVFQRLIATNIPMIMTAHILVPAIDTHHPITLSPQGVGQLLRRKMQFGGLIVSDDLEMSAVADRYSIDEAITRGLRAGLDLFLICHSADKWTAAWETLVRLGESNTADRELISMAAGRVRHVKEKWLRPWRHEPSQVDAAARPAHRVLIDRILAGAQP